MIKYTPILHNVSELIPNAADYLKKRKDVLFACLFGSMASETCNPLSDIDIAVYLKKGNLSEKRLELIGDLADIFKTDEIDLVILNTAPLSLRMRILKQRKILADNYPFFRHKYESITMRYWFDFPNLNTEYWKGGFSMVDYHLILRKISEFEQYLSQIREYSDISLSEYANDWKTQRIVERTLQMMIETCLDIASHIISDEKYRTPENYADMFKILFENKILNKTLLTALEKMAKFRNHVVHHYDKIDQDIVVSILHKNLNDFEKFSSSIICYLKDRQQEHNSV